MLHRENAKEEFHGILIYKSSKYYPRIGIQIQ